MILSSLRLSLVVLSVKLVHYFTTLFITDIDIAIVFCSVTSEAPGEYKQVSEYNGNG